MIRLKSLFLGKLINNRQNARCVNEFNPQDHIKRSGNFQEVKKHYLTHDFEGFQEHSLLILEKSALR